MLRLRNKHKPTEPFGQEQNNTFSLIERILFWLVTDPNSFKKYGDKNYNNLTAFNFIHLFGGRVQLYKSVTFHVTITYCCVISSIVFFMIFLAKWYWVHVSPAVVIVYVYIWLLIWVNLVLATFSDPGIFPRNVHYVSELPNDYNNWIALPTVGNKEVIVKYCTTCRNWKPPRCHHCIVCNSCVNEFDHHCLWVNNCVGLRNYAFFFRFILLSTLLSAYLNVMSYYYIVHNHFTRGGGIFLIIFSHFTMIYPFLLLIFHLYLTMNGLKTKEYLNRMFSGNFILRNDPSKNPFYQRNLLKNFFSSLFRPVGFSFIPFNSKYENTLLLSDLPRLSTDNLTTLQSESISNQNISQ